MPELVIVRGLPGSGKSTFAKKMSGFHHIETDMFFIDYEGNYKFDGSKLSEAHIWCLKHARSWLMAGHNVVVSNTFSRKWEMREYVLMTDYYTNLTILTMNGQFENTHNVPDHVIERMKMHWED